MRVLLVHTNLVRLPEPVPPAGLAWIAGALRAAGHEARILDLCWVRNRTAEISRGVRDARPDVIGVGISCLENGIRQHSLSFLPQIKWIVDRLRSLGPTPILVGGSGFSLFPREILQYLGLTWGLRGDGCSSIVQATEVVARGAAANGEEDAGLVRWDGHSYAFAPAAPAGPPSAPPAHDLVDYARYQKHGGAIPLAITRCLWQGASSEEIPAGYRDPEDVSGEIVSLSRAQAAEAFHLAGRLTVGDETYLERLLPRLRPTARPARFEAVLGAGGWNPDLAGALQASGFSGITLVAGFASTSQSETPDVAPRLAEARPFCDAAARARLRVAIHVLLGGPGETRATLRETLESLRALGTANLVLLDTGVRILPGSLAESRALDEGQVQRNESLLWPRYYLSPAWTRDEEERIRRLCRSNPTWRSPADLYSPAVGLPHWAARRLGIRPPWAGTAWLGWPRSVLARLGGQSPGSSPASGGDRANHE